MENQITVVVSSRVKHEEKKEYLDMLNETCGCDLEIRYVLNQDGVSLTTIYSDMIESESSDIIIFLHDDIEFLRPGWGTEIIRLFKENEEYGVIGVAGSAEFDEKGAWWNYNKKFGQVLHRNKKENNVWLSQFSPLLNQDLQEVAVVDGLFMAVCKSRISQNFDKTIKGFDMYDIDFCLSNFVDKKTKIGVTTNIRLAHDSVGELSDDWFKNLILVNNKFKKHYPIKI